MPKKYYYIFGIIILIIFAALLIYVWTIMHQANKLTDQGIENSLNPSVSWKQITDPILGFKFEYPSLYTATVLQSTKDTYPEVNHDTAVTNFIGAVNFRSSTNPDAYPSVTVSAYTKNSKTFNNWLSDNQILKADFSNQTSTIVGGNQYIKYSQPSGIYAPAELYIAEGNQMIYRIDFAANFKGEEQLVKTLDILKTFKFTK
jgi:hypothetical protein